MKPEMERSLLIVAVRCDTPPEVKRRMDVILAATGTYASPPDTTAAAWAMNVDDLTANDLERLAKIIGWDGVRGLNVGDVVATAPDREEKRSHE